MAAGTHGNGLATAVELAGGLGDLGHAEGEQAQLFADADDAPMPMPAAKGVSGAKGGRPRGARNRSTEEWRQFILSRYRSPAVFLAECYSRSPEELARQLELYKFHEGRLVTEPILDEWGRVLRDEAGHELRQPVLATGDAAAIQVQAAIALLPYLHQKQPLAIETKGETRGVMVIGDLSGGNVDQLQAMGFKLPLAPSQQVQQVIDAEVVKSDDTQSDALTNALTHNED